MNSQHSHTTEKEAVLTGPRSRARSSHQVPALQAAAAGHSERPPLPAFVPLQVPHSRL